MHSIEPWLVELIRGRTTPHYVVDLHVVRSQIHLLQNLLPDVTLYYSTKTNSEPAIIDTCIEEGMRFDVATIGEIEMLLERGVAPSGLLYTHPVKSVAEIQHAYALGVEQFVCDSVQELEKLNTHAPGSRFFVRFNPPKSSSLYDYSSRLGAGPKQLEEILDYAAGKNVPVTGLTFHVGSQSMSSEPWASALDLARKMLKKYYDSIPTLRVVNMGSGFPVDYGFGTPPSLQEIAKVIAKGRKSFPKDVEFWAEPGRPIAAPSTKLFISVVEKLKRDKIEWLFTDTTVYSGLIERVESGGVFSWPITSDTNKKPNATYNIAGKTLDPDDILGKDIKLSSHIKAGDLLILHNTGAYTAEFFTKYHSLPAPIISFYDSEHSDKVKISKSHLADTGVHSKRKVKEGEVLFTVSGHRTKNRTRTSFQIGEGLHVEPTLFGAYLNHSCDPNGGIRTNKNGLLDVVARKTIGENEEITVDYAMFEYELADMGNVSCRCQSLICRERIVGYKGLPDYKKEEYTSYISSHLLDLAPVKVKV